MRFFPIITTVSVASLGGGAVVYLYRYNKDMCKGTTEKYKDQATNYYDSIEAEKAVNKELMSSI